MDLTKTPVKKAALMAIFMLFAFCSYAGNLTVNITSSTGALLPGAKFKINKGPNYVGEYSAGSIVALQDGASYTIFGHYDGTSTSRITFLSSAAGNTYNFKTTNVKFHFSGGYLNFKTSGSWSSFGKTGSTWNARELFPKDYTGNTMEIQAAHVYNDRREVIFPLNFGDGIVGAGYSTVSSVVKTIAVIRVLNSANSPITGATARGGAITPTTWHVPGSTNANGLLVDLRDGNQTSLAYEAKVNNTIAVAGPQNPNTNSYYLFKTNLLSLQLLTCADMALSGGTVRYGNGANFSTWHFPGGSTAANGITSAEFFPGTYSFEMNYQGTAEVKLSQVIPNTSATLTWNTTNVTLNWPYGITYGGTGNSRHFSKPSMELLSGNYNFIFSSPGASNITNLAISGCSLSLNPGLIQLRSVSGAPISGGMVAGYQGSWTNYGTTGTNGNLLVTDKDPTSLQMTYLGGTEERNAIDFSVNPVVTFQTALITVEFKDSKGNPLVSATDQLEYSGGSWLKFGAGETDANGSATMELLPVAYDFRIGYGGATQQKTGVDVSINPLVVFNTVEAKVKLVDANDVPIPGGLTKYYAGSWFSMGNTDALGEVSSELLAGSYHFSVEYNGYVLQQNNINPVATNPILFKLGAIHLGFGDDLAGKSDRIKTVLYPNPATDKFRVKLPANLHHIKLQIFTLEGKLVKEQVLDMNNMSIDVASLSPGIYLVNSSYEERTQTQRLIISR